MKGLRAPWLLSASRLKTYLDTDEAIRCTTLRSFPRPPELFWLTMIVPLAATMWFPFMVGVNAVGMPIPSGTRPSDISQAPPWVHRAWRTHLNLPEQFLPFAVIALIAHLAEVSTPVTAGPLWRSP